MSFPVQIRKRDKCADWLTLDMLDVEDTGAVIVVPMFGPNHLSGADCWCHPVVELGIIIHNVMH